MYLGTHLGTTLPNIPMVTSRKTTIGFCMEGDTSYPNSQQYNHAVPGAKLRSQRFKTYTWNDSRNIVVSMIVLIEPPEKTQYIKNKQAENFFLTSLGCVDCDPGLSL